MKRTVENARERRLVSGLRLSTIGRLAEVSKPTMVKVEKGQPVTPVVASAVERVLRDLESEGR